MSRLKELRTASSRTQREVAVELGVSQQTYARWESGKAEPPHKALREIARIFQSSVDHILGPGPAPLAARHRLDDLIGEAGYPWGHIGLRLPGAAFTNWYPVSEGQASRVRQSLATGHDVSGWLVALTLNNRALAFRPKEMQRIWLLDDASGEPVNDFQFASSLDEEATSLEIYRAMAAWVESELESENKFFTSIPKKVQKEVWSKIHRCGYSNRVTELRDLLLCTTLYYADGQKFSYEADRASLADLFLYIGAGAPLGLIDLPAKEGEFECFSNANMLRLIEFPLIELEAAWEKSDD